MTTTFAPGDRLGRKVCITLKVPYVLISRVRVSVGLSMTSYVSACATFFVSLTTSGTRPLIPALWMRRLMGGSEAAILRMSSVVMSTTWLDIFEVCELGMRMSGVDGRGVVSRPITCVSGCEA